MFHLTTFGIQVFDILIVYQLCILTISIGMATSNGNKNLKTFLYPLLYLAVYIPAVSSGIYIYIVHIYIYNI